VHGTAPLEEDGTPTYERTITLSHQGEPVGELAVGKRPGDPLRPAENRLLEAVGSQVALALHSLRLAERLRAKLEDLKRTTGQLEASRRRIVTAQDAERSRLERDIHDRVETPLVEIAATIANAERTMTRSKAGAIGLLDEAAVAANEVQDRLRDLARGIFPPLLADRGVVSALESQARKTVVPVAIRAATLEQRFDSHAEAAVYFCCVEAMQSAARRAGGSPIDVTLAADEGWISFVVRDGAHGLSDAALTGAELQQMVDRIESVGGRLEVHTAPEGTTVSGRVPAQPATADAHASASRSGSNADFGT
jgi:signal transduction histidine kinase